jgi:hypothetical protein
MLYRGNWRSQALRWFDAGAVRDDDFETNAHMQVLGRALFLELPPVGRLVIV